MSDSKQVRLNELARELEIKAKVLIDYLPEIGVKEKKTHSSSIDIEHAELARKHFLGLAAAEAAAEAAKTAAAKAKTARPAPAPAAAPAAKPAGPAAVPPRTAPPTPGMPLRSSTAPPALTASPAGAPLRPAAAPMAPAAAPGHPTTHPTTAPRPGVAPVTTAPRPGVPPAQRPAAASPAGAPAGVPGSPRPAGAPPAAPRFPARPGQPGQYPARPGAPQGMRPAAAPGQIRPSGPPRPGGPPGRFPQRPGGRPGSSEPVGSQRPGATGGVPKAEPGKPLYARKPPASRGRPTIEKRYAEGERRLHPVRTRAGVGAGRAAHVEPVAPVQREPRAVTVTEGITVRELAEKLDIRAKELLKTLLDKGVFASINQALDVQTATSLAESFNGIVQVVTYEEQLVEEEKIEVGRTGNALPRAPVVTVMGHVDHGKTSLLDAIRETEVAAGEAGGITQHIGASVVHIDGRKVVFIDTPGHEAFTRMRARGAKVTDIVVLVVAADDGVMPQTQEAIDHAKAANVPIIVAINKIDKPDSQPERVKRQLADRGLMPEEWGGDTVMVEVSAKQKKNLSKLLEMLLLVADLRDLKSNPKAPAAGTVLESRVDRGRGAVATILVQTGTLNTGDVFICGAVYGKVRAMFDDHGRTVKTAGPSTPVEVLGLQGAPEAGDQFQVTDEARARHIVEFRQSKLREATLARSAGARITLHQLHEQLKAGDVKELPLVIKGDVQGSVEVLSEMLPKLSDDRVKLKI